ncbi:hypothetical protein SUDANB176_06225 [Streptomyces sp. enrichment culture]
MVVFAVLVPLLMLGVVLVLGRYEDLVLPPRWPDTGDPADRTPAA